MLRILHTSDWHIGQSLRDLNREEEHTHFLNWLFELIEKERYHATLVAGDIFDGPNPSARAQEMLYQFLEKARHFTTLVVIAGNHDSAERLDAPSSLLRQLGIFVAGAWPEQDQYEKLLFPVRGDGESALILAMPFLRNCDLGRIDTQEPNWYAQAHKRRWEQLHGAAKSVQKPDQCLVGMAHCYVSGASINEDTERRIGQQDEIPVDIFPQELAYLALGHLHRTQRIQGLEHIRYSGSILPLGFSEIDYAHQVTEVHIENGKVTHTTPRFIPRVRELLRVPAKHAPWEEVEQAIRSLPDAPIQSLRPWAEVRVKLPPTGIADLRTQVETLFTGKHALLFRIDALAVESQNKIWEKDSLALDDMTPRDIFLRICEEKQIDGIAREELFADFENLLREQGLA